MGSLSLRWWRAYLTAAKRASTGKQPLRIRFLTWTLCRKKPSALNPKLGLTSPS